MSEAQTALAVPESEIALAPVSLFGTSDPVEVIGKATATAKALKQVIEARRLVTNIRGKEHVQVEAWTLLGSMLGVFPVCEWTRPVIDENGRKLGWEARVEAITISGAKVGAAEAQCLRFEHGWGDRDDFALRSMAQTRATSKALRMPLGFVVQLAGYSPTPAEEMGSQETGSGRGPDEHSAGAGRPDRQPEFSDPTPVDQPRGKKLHVIRPGPRVQANHDRLQELISDIYFKAYQIEHHERERLGHPTDAEVVKTAAQDRVDTYINRAMGKKLNELTEAELSVMLEKLSKSAAEAEK